LRSWEVTLRSLSGAIAACAVVLVGCNGEPGNSAGATDAESGSKTASGPLVYCVEVSRQVPQDDCDYYNRLAAATKQGAAALNAPDPMWAGKQAQLELAIGTAPNAPVASDSAATTSAASSQVAAMSSTSPPSAAPSTAASSQPPTPAQVVAPLPGKVVEFQPRVGRFMAATLSGQGFEITPAGPQHKEVPLDSVTTWTWNVTATDKSSDVLLLTTVVEAPGPNNTFVELRSTTWNEPVHVKVGFWYRLGQFILRSPFWIKAVTAVVAAVTSLVGAWFAFTKLFRKSDPQP